MTQRQGYSLGRRITLGCVPPRHVRNAVRARQKSASFPPSLFPLSPFFSDRRPALLSFSAPASIRHASDVTSAGWNANTLPSAVCADPTSQSPRSPQMGPRSPPSRKDRKPASALPPCPPSNAGECIYGVSSRGSSIRKRDKVSSSKNRPSSLLLLPPPPPHHPRRPHRLQVVGAWDTCPYPNPKRRP